MSMSEKSDKTKKKPTKQGETNMSKSNKNTNTQVKKVDTIEVPTEVKTETAPTRAELIQKYRDLGKSMTTLREEHLKDIEKLIVQYKADKAAIKAKREQLLIEIRKPKADKTESEPTEAELKQIESETAEVA